MIKKDIEDAEHRYPLTLPLPPLLPVADVQRRLAQIFPESFHDRSILVGTTAARVVFVFLYGGFIEGHGRYLRPSHVYLFTEDQSLLTTDADRMAWLATANRPGQRTAGERWYADNSRETIRDDLMRNRLLTTGIMLKLPGIATTSSKPINFLADDFVQLFAPTLSGEALDTAIAQWRNQHLNPTTLSRMALRAQGIHAKTGDVLIDLPDQTRIRISTGTSALIAKGLIEEFAPRHLVAPAVLWLSASDKKAYPQFVELAASVGLHLDLNAELPDVILVDTAAETKFYFCEIVFTDGAVTEQRKRALLNLVSSSNIPPSAVRFVTAFEHREAQAFRKNFSQLALDTSVWFRTEPDLLVVLTTAAREAIDPNK